MIPVGRGDPTPRWWSSAGSRETSWTLVERIVRVCDEPVVELNIAASGGPFERTLLVVHGGPDWDHTCLREPLVRLQGVRLLFVDLRGCGRSTRGLPPAAYTPAVATNDLLRLLDVLGLAHVDVLGSPMAA